MVRPANWSPAVSPRREIQEDVMGLISHVVAAGIGYYAGQPEGRRQLKKLRRQAVEFAHGPEFRRLRERGWDVAGDGALAARNFAARTFARTDPGADSVLAGEIADTRSGRNRILWRRPRPRHATASQTSGPIVADTDSPPGTTVAENSATSGLGSTGAAPATQTPPSGPENRS
jgi:hypothetical protein